GEQARRGSGVDHQRIPRLDKFSGGRGNTGAFWRMNETAQPDAGLVDQRAAGAAAVGPLQRTAFRQLVQVAARGLGRDTEGTGKRRDPNDAVAPQQGEDLRVPFRLGESDSIYGRALWHDGMALHVALIFAVSAMTAHDSGHC